MSRFLLHLTPILILPLLAFSLVARALGSTQPPNPALAGFTTDCEDKPQPCWYGIVLGITTAEEAYERLSLEFNDNLLDNSMYTTLFYAENAPSICFGRIDIWRNSVNRIDLNFCPASIQVGELVALMGEFPIQISENPLALYFNAGRPSYIQISLYDFVEDIGIFYAEPNLDTWHGFVPKWRYCQLEPDAMACM